MIYIVFLEEPFPIEAFCHPGNVLPRQEKGREANLPGPSFYPTRASPAAVFHNSTAAWVGERYPENLRPAGPLNPSGAPIAHRALAVFHQHRHFAHPLGEF